MRFDRSKMCKVQLSPAEVAFSLAIAIQRDACKPEPLREQRHSKTQSGFGVNFAGVLGEVAFRKVHGGKIDQTIMPYGDKHKPDIILPDKRRVEVKTATYTGYDVELKFEQEELDFEWCSLTQIIGWPDIINVFPIWAKADLTLTEKDYGNGMRWMCPPPTR